MPITGSINFVPSTNFDFNARHIHRAKMAKYHFFFKIFCNQPLFGKGLTIYHFFETRFCELELHQKISKFFHGT